MGVPAADLDVVIVSHGDGRWLKPCLESLRRHAGGCATTVTVVENKAGAEVPPEVTAEHGARLLRTANRGFAAANNEGLRLGSARHVLFLNPDTELRAGSLADAVRYLDEHPDVGMLATKQVDADGHLWPSMRRFPTVARTLAQALGSERWPLVGGRVGERILDMDAYERETDCDWTTGAVMFVRREALATAGDFDERFFLFSEETDLAARIKQAGWRVVHTPRVIVAHYAGKAGVDPRREAQAAYARMQYARKHMGRLGAAGIFLAHLLGHGLRRVALARRATSSSSGEASRAALRALVPGAAPPYPHDESVTGRLEARGAAADPRS